VRQLCESRYLALVNLNVATAEAAIQRGSAVAFILTIAALLFAFGFIAQEVATGKTSEHSGAPDHNTGGGGLSVFGWQVDREFALLIMVASQSANATSPV
jgi:hypothetical protein